MHENPDQKFDLNFSYLIFQPDPRHDRVYYYLDGDPVKRILKRDDFYRLAGLKQPEIQGHIQNSCNDYSFHLWSVPDRTVTHLSLSSKDATYRDERMDLVSKRRPSIIREKGSENKSILDTLSLYGFEMPTAESLKNLQVNLKKQDTQQQGIFSRLFNLKGK